MLISAANQRTQLGIGINAISRYYGTDFFHDQEAGRNVMQGGKCGKHVLEQHLARGLWKVSSWRKQVEHEEEEQGYNTHNYEGDYGAGQMAEECEDEYDGGDGFQT